MAFLSNVPSSIARDGFNITPSNTPLAKKAYGVRCDGTAGTLVGITDGGTTLTFNIQQFETIPMCFKSILPATTATGLIGYDLYK